MPHYIILLNWAEQGIRNVKDTIKRAENFKAAVEKAGGKFVGHYYTLGKHDSVTIVEAPNDETIILTILAAGSWGNVRTETLKAFTMDEAAKIIERL
jgi:uncharacterized protein with GYD domain